MMAKEITFNLRFNSFCAHLWAYRNVITTLASIDWTVLHKNKDKAVIIVANDRFSHWQKRPLIGHSLNTVVSPSLWQNTLLLVNLSTMLYPNIVNTVASPSHWQKRPLIVVIISTLLHHPLIGKNTLLLVILSIMLYPLIVKNVLLLVTISTLLHHPLIVKNVLLLVNGKIKGKQFNLVLVIGQQ